MLLLLLWKDIFPFSAIQLEIWLNNRASLLDFPPSSYQNFLEGDPHRAQWQIYDEFPFYTRALCKFDVNLYFSNYQQFWILAMNSGWNAEATQPEVLGLLYKRKLGHRQNKKYNTFVVMRLQPPIPNVRWNAEHATLFACSEFVISS